jgi:RimJ/RimL family protein N-acetyltransferase
VRLLLRKVIGKALSWKRSVIFYVWKPSFLTSPLPQKSEFHFLEFKDFNGFPSNSFSDDLQHVYQERFNKRHLCCALLKNGLVVSSGWINTENNHFVGELNFTITVDDYTEVLYDFHTDESFRGMGLYPLLLQTICLRNDKSKLIYVLSHNKSSKRGIEKANFQFLDIVKFYNKRKLDRILSNL